MVETDDNFQRYQWIVGSALEIFAESLNNSATARGCGQLIQDLQEIEMLLPNPCAATPQLWAATDGEQLPSPRSKVASGESAD